MSKIIAVPPQPPVFGVKKGDKSQDSLGNPNSPGYDNSWGNLVGEQKADTKTAATTPTPATAPVEEKMVKGLRLLHGWDTLLAAQKTICAKALQVLTVLEAPQRYFLAKRGKSIIKKVNGNILDFSAAEKSTELAELEKHKQLILSGEVPADLEEAAALLEAEKDKDIA